MQRLNQPNSEGEHGCSPLRIKLGQIKRAILHSPLCFDYDLSHSITCSSSYRSKIRSDREWLPWGRPQPVLHDSSIEIVLAAQLICILRSNFDVRWFFDCSLLIHVWRSLPHQFSWNHFDFLAVHHHSSVSSNSLAPWLFLFRKICPRLCTQSIFDLFRTVRFPCAHNNREQYDY